ncbi:hypothetical protein [Fluviicoccus keumensis]|uniref:hypothetical protein n=1 Tax=Fluviicoccus keumensis TaxID=1435465 RepID=UPI00102B5CCA|nr:hypothetical protein [Fluviicoccus keumensis]
MRKRLEVSTDIREPVFGEIYYDYHLGHHFSALNSLIGAKQAGVFEIDDPTTEMLLGDLYTEFGLPREGDVAISRVQAQDIPSSTRNMPWLRYGKLLYQLGNDAPTENYLRKPPSTLTSYQEAERRLMLANILIRKRSFNEAINMLKSMPAEGAMANYGVYNLGIAYLQGDQPEEGLARLDSLANQNVTDEEGLNLKDKAALAVAYYHIQNEDYELGRQSLLRVRLEGPYSNQSLLALAYSHYLNKAYAETLPACLELQRRNPADPAVQEAFLLSARVYEEMGFKAQALAGYRIANKVLREQLLQLEKTSLKIDGENWPDIMAPRQVNTEDLDPLNVKQIPATNDAITAGLFAKLFASPKFNEGFRQYQQVSRLVQLLEERHRDVDALQEIAKTLENRKDNLSVSADRQQALKDQYVALIKRWQDLQLRFKQMNSSAEAYTDAASQAENARLQQLNRLGRKLQKLKSAGTERDVRDIQARLDRLKSITLFEIARHAASRDEIFDKLQQSTAQLRLTKSRLAVLDNLLSDNQQIQKAAYSQRLPILEKKINELEVRVTDAKGQYRDYLKNLARSLLQERRDTLTNYLGETYLGTERVESKPAPAAPTEESTGKS